jgi:NhaA family Na+:H+ antiporter
MAGLLIGKPVGITLFSWILVKLKLGRKPSGSSWGQLAGTGLLAGIGFTMSIFITLLAFGDAGRRDTSKLTVLLASLPAIIGGVIVLWLTAPRKNV